MKLLSTLLLVTLTVSAALADSIATIQLRNRPAVEVIPIVRPMLGAGDAISGQGFRIFLRSSPQTLAQVKDMIAALDIASQMLQISVFQGSTRGISELGIRANIEVAGGDTKISAGTGVSADGNSGGSITHGTDSGSGSIDGISTRTRMSDNPIHQIRVADGSEGYIETGRQIPVFSGTSAILPRGVVGGVEYRDVVTGFYVLPRIHGDSVTLEVSPFRSSNRNADGGSIETQSARTTITGRIGEWLPVGGVTEQLRRKQSGIGSQVSTESRNDESIWIKADLIR